MRTFQHVRLAAGMSVLENIALGADRRGTAGLLRAMLRLDRAEARALLAEAARHADDCGLTTHLAEPAGDLALGLQRIVEVPRALAADPTVPLLDEPAAGLRAAEKHMVAGLPAKGVAVLIVEQNARAVLEIADRGYVLELGAVTLAGPAKALAKDPRVIETYLGR